MIAIPEHRHYIERVMVETASGAGGRATKQWTVLSLLEWATAYLAERSFDEARLHAELLLAHVLSLPRLHLYLQFDRPLTSGELATFKTLFLRRVTHEPLQYILGEIEFMGLRFAVDRRVMIPRPETEHLVEAVVDSVKARNVASAEILDIGTGSGNIAVAVATMIPGSRVTSIDVSPDALDVARRNARANNAGNVCFLEADIFEDCLPGRRFDVIAANPPYVDLASYEGLQAEVREFEPRRAVTDEADGFRFIRRIAGFAAVHLVPDGALFMEIAYNQGDAAVRLVSAAGLSDVTVWKDYADHPRVVGGVVRRASP